MSRRLVPALVATAAALLIAILLPAGARAGDGALADAIRQAFGGTVAATGAADDDVLTWDAATRTWGAAAAPAGGATIHSFRIRKTADQTFTTTGETATWDTEDLDEAGWIDLAGANTKVLTAAAACEVDIVFRVRWIADDDPILWLICKRFNSSDVQQERWDANLYHGEATQATYQVFPVKLRMAAGDYVTLQGFVPGLADGSCAWDDISGTLANGGGAAYAHGTIRLTE